MTVNTLVQGAWALVLARHTGQTKVVFGATVAGRPSDLEGVESLVGLFINTLPVVVEVEGATRLGAWLRSVQAQSVALQEHAHVALGRVQQLAEVDGRALFDSIVVFENFPVDDALRDFRPDGLHLGRLSAHEETNYPLTLLATQKSTLELEYRYAREHFDERTIVSLAGHVERLLEQMTARGNDGNSVLDQFGHAGDQDRASLIDQARGAERGYPSVPVHEQIARQAEGTPDAVAVLFGDERLSYAELDAYSNRLANRLTKLGVRPEVRVGIAMERSEEMVVGLLAILKAGGAYVPLDPEYPGERLSYMMEDSGIGLLLTQSHLLDALPLPAGLKVIELDTLNLSGEPPTAPQVDVHGENLAYVIYTSGSTGRPKGAANRHSALANRLAWMQSAYGLGENDVVLQKTPFSFDVSVWEFFWPLMTGATLVVAEPGAHRNPQRLVALINAHGVTTLHFVPSMLQAFVTDEGVASCTSLKRIVCSGEALPAELANRTLERLPAASVYNLYGPTEAAIDVTHWTCVPGDDVVPIGRPIDNLHTYVLDDSMNLTLPGVAGELYLGGAGLARGYLDRAGLTSERFVPNPFDVGGGRLYRTGDLARWSAAVALEYLGRIDYQVKIRGFRIELGEVEAQLQAQPEVREAVVMARSGSGGNTRLIGYVTAAQTRPDVVEVRARLARALPDYMVPAAIVVLDALPLNPNGKVDRKALPEPDEERLDDPLGLYAVPRTEMEAKLLACWKQALAKEDIRVSDHFFEIGGTSLDTLKVATLAKSYGIHDFTIQLLFAQPVLSSLARVLAQPSRALPENVLPMNSVSATKNLFAIHPGFGLVAEYRHLAGALDGQFNVYGIEAPFYSDPLCDVETIGELAAMYVDAMRAVQPRGPYRLLGWSMGGIIALNMAYLLRQQGDEVAFAGLIDCFIPDSQHVEGGADEEIEKRLAQLDGEQLKYWTRVREITNRLLPIALTHEQRPLDVDLHLWWALRSEIADVSHHTKRWQAETTGNVTVVDAVDTDHMGIIRNESVFEGLGRLLDAVDRVRS
ncbi:non-ribosomal peptide synthetase [Paraburkholderia tropica]|uniref:non-ribosomal peptide synthetase n=1 Tax=Paraburkholderia tropica TaxID=92647 RepID=UPI0007ECE1E7|nr:non-ribosomal peptide synthetase [Paraburkholderia tropica]OBR50063.1 hypothetical protein A6456_33890 [Paraburkholderia tropica]